ncbi:hypothetical protein SH661x_002312 [Planctomicrobium sp. SH661]|uniref:hypothetical protein n=1 Tax=Planctomicrobium sp. SH661 TaxID=3448124 RepID=UPI003F5CABE3
MAVVITTQDRGNFPFAAACNYLGLDPAAFDQVDVVTHLYNAAVDLVQETCSIQLIDAEGVLKLDQFPRGNLEIQIPRPPVREILEFTYLDRDGSPVTLSPSEYQFDGDSKPGRLLPAPGKVWPSTLRDAIHTVVVRFKCGPEILEGQEWPTPPSAQRLVFYLMGYWYENRLQAGNAPNGDPFYEQQLSLLRWI